MSVLKQVTKFPKTYKRFNTFIFKQLGNNQENFRKFNSYPDRFRLPFFIDFLESEGVPIVSAVVYYQYLYKGTPSYEQLLSYTVAAEFKRIELDIKINYTPF